MRDAHLTADDLEKLLQGDDLTVYNRLLLHHLALCPECRAVGGYLLELYEAGAVDLELCTIDIGFALSRRDAPQLLEKLSEFPFKRQMALVRKKQEFRSWGLCELLCEASLRQAPNDADRAVELAKLAVEIAMLLKEWEPAELYWLEELRGYAWAHLGNGYRVKGELPMAVEAFETSDGWWQKGNADAGDVLGYEVRLLDLKASLRRAQRQLPEARKLLAQALELETSPTGRGRLLITKAKVLEEGGEYDEALRTLESAEGLLGQDAEPRLRLCIAHNRIWLLAISGRHLEAKLLLPDVVRLSRQIGNDPDLVRLRWVEGQIEYAFGNLPAAREAFGEVRERFVKDDLVFDAALVSLELAALHARAGEPEAAKAIAREILPLFGVRKVPRETVASLGLFIQAVEAETLTEDLARQVIGYLRRTRSEGLEPSENDAVH